MKYIFYLFFFFVSCTKNPTLSVEMISSQTEKHQSKKFILQSEDASSMQLEILKLSDEIKGYITFLQPTLLYNEKDPLSLVQLTSDNTVVEDVGRWLKGGQKLLLSDKITNKLLISLKEKKPVYLRIEDYQMTIHIQDFNKQYEDSLFNFAYFLFKNFKKRKGL